MKQLTLRAYLETYPNVVSEMEFNVLLTLTPAEIIIVPEIEAEFPPELTNMPEGPIQVLVNTTWSYTLEINDPEDDFDPNVGLLVDLGAASEFASWDGVALVI